MRQFKLSENLTFYNDINDNYCLYFSHGANHNINDSGIDECVIIFIAKHVMKEAFPHSALRVTLVFKRGQTSCSRQRTTYHLQRTHSQCRVIRVKMLHDARRKAKELKNGMEKWNIIYPSLQSETKPNANGASRALKSAIGPKILERLINYTFQ